VTEAARPAAEAAYAAHLAAVRGYFHGPEASDERRGRLLEVDFGANDTARLVCDFALGHVHGAAAARERCAGLGRMPRAQPNAYCYQCRLPNGEWPLPLPRRGRPRSDPSNASGCVPRPAVGWTTSALALFG